MGGEGKGGRHFGGGRPAAPVCEGGRAQQMDPHHPEFLVRLLPSYVGLDGAVRQLGGGSVKGWTSEV